MKNTHPVPSRLTARLLPLLFALASAGCTAYVKDGPALTDPAETSARERALASYGESRAPAAERTDREPEKKKDDFIDVDDRRGLRKSWPMALFIGLLAAILGAL